jgi:hypothetical protein
VAWSGTAYETWFIVEYRAAHNSSWQRISVGGFDCQLSGLQTGTTYLWRVGVWCNGTEVFGNTQFFTTPSTNHSGNGNGGQNTGVGEGLLYMSIPYPNPSNGQFSFDLVTVRPEDSGKPQELVVFSLAGEEIYRSTVTPSQQGSVEIEFPEYIQSGFYVLKIGKNASQRIQLTR